MEQYIFRQKETRTVLLDKLGVVAALCEQAEREGEQEHCVLAMARKTGEAVYELFDSCAVEEMGGKHRAKSVHRPPKGQPGPDPTVCQAGIDPGYSAHPRT